MTDENAPDLASGLRHTVTRLYLTLRRNSPISELSAAQASGLASLVDYGPMRMGEFAERESIRMPTATALIDGLHRGGYVSREPDPDDRRAVIIAATDTGSEIVSDIRTRRDDSVTRALQTLSDDHRAALAAALPALRELQTRMELS
ncbi:MULTISPECIES: MarR family winged helix-turn-helix transcriptional regulator [Gordonia]|uniref:MarR family transcriptional regulator n=1 Tax=Gordonia cholesterolivorans TaxID=559625 RepID=A0ABN3H3B7_9ACTN|nr:MULTISPECIES: MarR family transcriptional regulator [Gordonia]KJR08116.1 MarR family transcriptional regulator [Gordonia sihwensis]KXT56954.1 MarR family transcriptional regulator [Gordonia sp. QH-12]MBY4568453.1 MarR family transcriptional regulator [Gordonia sihwensis]WFN92794.1 MarR family transcriptional regulator [Gordonia sihwensis]